jgi:Na+/melibiose symporter-like transporter
MEAQDEPAEVVLMPSPPGGPAPTRLLSLSQLVMLNAIVCGLEFCASAAFCYIPPMLLKAGISEENMSMIIGVGPLLGFFIVPVIGRASDRCRSPFGRRRPFIFILSLLLIFSLIIIPYGEVFGTYIFGKGTLSKSTGIALLVLGAVMLDFTSQACLTPCEALLSDACKSTNQQDRCFVVYSFMVSLGGCIGYLITALDWSTSSVGIYFGNQEKSAFSMLIVLFVFSMVATLGIAQEHPVLKEVPSAQDMVDLQLQKKLDQVHQAIVQQKNSTNVPDPGYETGSNQSLNDEYMNGNAPVDVDALLGAPPPSYAPRTSPFNIHIFLQLVRLRLYSLLPETIQALLSIPFVLKRLALANFCSWTAVMCFNLFFTDFVGQAVYGGDPNAPENSRLQELYDEGVRMGSWGLLFHCVTSAIYAVFVERMVKRFGTRNTYFLGMCSFTLAMTVMVFSRSIVIITLMAACTGFAYATVTTIPFVLVTQYHADKEVCTTHRLKLL